MSPFHKYINPNNNEKGSKKDCHLPFLIQPAFSKVPIKHAIFSHYDINWAHEFNAVAKEVFGVNKNENDNPISLFKSVAK